jgi:hypothetical protein
LRAVKEQINFSITNTAQCTRNPLRAFEIKGVGIQKESY